MHVENPWHRITVRKTLYRVGSKSPHDEACDCIKWVTIQVLRCGEYYNTSEHQEEVPSGLGGS